MVRTVSFLGLKTHVWGRGNLTKARCGCRLSCQSRAHLILLSVSVLIQPTSYMRCAPAWSEWKPAMTLHFFHVMSFNYSFYCIFYNGPLFCAGRTMLRRWLTGCCWCELSWRQSCCPSAPQALGSTSPSRLACSALQASTVRLPTTVHLHAALM